MKKTFLILSLFLIHNLLLSQTVIKMKSENGVSVIPCKVNGLKLNFIFDTGASDVSISLTEALFMLKNEYLDTSDIVGTLKYQDATGKISEGVTINLKEIEIGGLKLYNINATIIKNSKAPLLLGQSAISKLGKIEVDLTTNTLTILNGENNIVDSSLLLKNSPLTEDDYIEVIKLKMDKFDNIGIISDCNKILQINPQSKYAYFFRGYAKFDLDNYEDAINDFTKTIEIDSTDAMPYSLRGISKKLNVQTEKNGVNGFLITSQDTGFSKTELNAYKSALMDFDKCISLDPNNDYFYSNRANLFNTLKKYSFAIEDFDKAIQLNNSTPEYYIERGDINQKLEKYKEAIADYNQALYLDSSDYTLYLKRGNAKFKLKKCQSAIDDFNKGIQLNPQEGKLFISRGIAKEHVGDFEGALNDYNRTLQIDSSYFIANLYIALLKEKMIKPEWYKTTTSQNGSKFFIKTENVSKEGSIIKFWEKAEIKTMTFKKNGKKINYTNVKQLMLIACDCESKLFKFYKSVFYNSKGDVIESSNNETVWENIIPETVMDTIFKKACELFH